MIRVQQYGDIKRPDAVIKVYGKITQMNEERKYRAKGELVEVYNDGRLIAHGRVCGIFPKYYFVTVTNNLVE